MRSGGSRNRSVRWTYLLMPRKRKSRSEINRIKRGLPYQDFVASVVKAMDPGAHVETEQWIMGPDGVRDRDVLVSGKIDGRKYSVLIECKDFNPKSTGKVGIEYVDSLDSKRNDVGVDGAVICSNSGFTEGAIRKAKRKQIGLVSILKAGDPRVKVEIQEELYTRKMRVSDIKMHYNSNQTVDSSFLQIPSTEIYYDGLPIANWSMNRIGAIIAANKIIGTANIRAEHRFITPVQFIFQQEPVPIIGLDLRFSVDVNWFSHLVTLDASLGIYDYMRGRVRLAPGQSQYMIKNLDIHDGSPIDFLPEERDLFIGLQPGEIDVDLMLVENLMMYPQDQTPALDAFIVPEDLELKIK